MTATIIGLSCPKKSISLWSHYNSIIVLSAQSTLQIALLSVEDSEFSSINNLNMALIQMTSPVQLSHQNSETPS